MKEDAEKSCRSATLQQRHVNQQDCICTLTPWSDE